MSGAAAPEPASSKTGGAAQTESGALALLSGVRVLALAINLPVPVAAARLRALGASVTKVEPPGGDPLERACPSWYHSLVEGQQVARLDLKIDEQRARLDELLGETDVLLTSTRPAALERLGLGGADLRVRHPRLCHVALVGYPAPDQNRAGHDLTYQASVGLVKPPELPLTLVADIAASERVVATAAALLYARERSGRGEYAEIAIADAVAAFADPLGYGLTRPGDGVLGGALPGYGIYPAADGWVAVAALEAHFLERLVRELQLASLSHDQLAAIFRTRTAAEWERWADERDLPVAAVRS